MIAENLLKLADYLDNVPDDKFRYWSWSTGPDVNACGTSACALGHATNIPEFGLEIRSDGNQHPRYYVALAEASPEHTTMWSAPRAAGAKVFGLNETEFSYLFSPDDNDLGSDATAEDVADHIRTFVERGGMPE